jgi:hypothetical protein
MHGTITVAKPDARQGGEVVLLTPELATELLEHNTWNRPISDAHVKRIAKQITDGRWRFNGDTIKLSTEHDVLDGQHRCWAVVETKIPVDTIIVTGIDKAAFATIDTLRKPRTGGDVIALSGQTRHRSVTAQALAWLLRWQRGVLERYKEPVHRIENSDIEEAFATHQKGIVRAVERAVGIRKIANPSLMGFIYYIASNQNPELAEQMMASLDDPGRLPQQHPFYLLRSYYTAFTGRLQKDPLVSIALTFKALNAVHRGQTLKTLKWQSQGSKPESFPALSITAKAKKEAA